MQPGVVLDDIRAPVWFRVRPRAGGKVRSGDLIGYVGSTECSAGPHLHYGVRVNGVPKDPLMVSQRRAAPIRTAAVESFEKETGKLAALF